MRKMEVEYNEYTKGIIVHGYEYLRLLIREFAHGDMVLRMAENSIANHEESLDKPRPEQDVRKVDFDLYNGFGEWFSEKMLFQELDSAIELSHIIRRSRQTKGYLEIVNAILSEMDERFKNHWCYRMHYIGVFTVTKEDGGWPKEGEQSGAYHYWKPDVDAGALFGAHLEVEVLDNEQQIYCLVIGHDLHLPDVEDAFALEHSLSSALIRTGAHMKVGLEGDTFAIDFDEIFAILNPILGTVFEGEKEVIRILESTDAISAHCGGIHDDIYLDISVDNLGQRFKESTFHEKPKGEPGYWTTDGAVLRGPAKISLENEHGSTKQKFVYPVVDVTLRNAKNPRGEMIMDLLPIFHPFQQEYARVLATRVFDAFIHSEMTSTSRTS